MLTPWRNALVTLLAATTTITAELAAGGVLHFMQASDQRPLAEQGRAGLQLELRPAWHVLGPFQIGTREAVWGADPLAAAGGFAALADHDQTSVASSLAASGSVGWSQHSFEPQQLSGGGAAVQLKFAFPSVDWRAFKDVYGWAALQAQAWARGSFNVLAPDSQRIALYIDNVLEFSIDGQHYFGGDFFAYRRAPLILDLAPGRHALDLRLTRDARASGAVGHEPTLDAAVELRVVTGDLQIDLDHSILPDIVNGTFASAHGSISLQNSCSDVIDIEKVQAVHANGLVSLSSDDIPKLEPGQSRPIPLRLASHDITQQSLPLVVTYRLRNKHQTMAMLSTSMTLTFRSIDEAHVFTYKHPSGIVSKAIIRPPQQTAHRASETLPIMVNLHGAGLAVDTPQMMQSLDEVSDMPTWFIFPSGVTTWSSDDWHNWGWADAQAAIAAVPQWIEHNHWRGSGVDTERLFVIGHSNGGQGVLHATTHWPDLIIAASSVSGYLSIQSYVPFQLWRETDPLRLAVFQAAMNDFRHELLSSNAQDVPLFLQHGDADDNVPPYHSRRLGQILQEQAIAVTYSEAEGKGHWWDGAQVTPGLQDFYRAHISAPQPDDTPANFTFVVANPSTTGSKHGLRVERSSTPGQLSKVSVSTTKSNINLQTSNILEFSLPNSWLGDTTLHIDGQRVQVLAADKKSGRNTFARAGNGTWRHGDGLQYSEHDSSNLQLGSGLQAILRTPGRIGIDITTEEARANAISIAQSFYQYFAADVVLSDSPGKFYEKTGHVISVGIGDSIDRGPMAHYPIKISGNDTVIVDCSGVEHHYGPGEKELGAVFLRPYKEDLLQLVVWGSNANGLALARRLVPTVTGAGQPDFVVLNGNSKVTGIDGALAMGFFDARWNITRSSFIS